MIVSLIFILLFELDILYQGTPFSIVGLYQPATSRL